MNLKPLLLYFTLTLFPFVYVHAQCDGSFLETIIFECDAPFDMDNRTTFGFIPGTWSGGAYIDSDGVFTPTGLAPGDYTVTFTTSSPPCNPFTNFIVTVAATPEVLLTQNTFEMCDNDAPLDLATFEDAATTPGFWDGPGVNNNNIFNPTGLSGAIEVTFTAFCDIDDPTSCTPPFIPNPVCGCDDNFYNSACEAELAGVTTYTPWIPNFPPSCPANSGCDPDEKIFTITVNPSTTATLTTNILELCDEDPPIDLDDFVAPSSDAGTWDASTTFDPSVVGIGNYFFEFSTGTDDCDDSAMLNIVVEESLDVILTQASLIVCSDDGFINLNDYVAANSDAGTWSGTGVNSTSGIFNINVAGIDTHTLSFNTGFDICDDNATFVIVVNESTEVILTANELTICSTDSFVDLSEFIDPASDPGTWSGTGISNDFFNPEAGSQVLTYATPPSSCSSSADLVVTVVPTPDAILNTNEAETCFSNGIVDLSQYVDAASDEGIWAGQGVTSLTSEFDVSAGTQTITFTTFSGDCEDVETLDIIVHPSPVAALTEENLSFCSTTSTVDLSTFLTPDTDSGNWTGLGIDADGITFDLSFGNQTLTYTTNLGVCDESVELNIEVSNPADASTIAPSESQLCSNSGVDFIQTLDLSSLIVGDAGGVWTYSPLANGFDPISGDTFDADGLPEGNYTLTYSIDTGEPCGIASSSQNIEVINCQLNCTADASFNAPTDLCGEANSILDLNTLITGDTGGVWTSDAPIGAISGNSFNPDGISGSFTLTYTVQDTTEGCPDAVQNAPINVIAPPADASTIAPVENFCLGDAGTNLFLLVPNNPVGTWSSADAPSAIDSDGFFSFDGLAAGQYEVTYTIEAQAPCTTDASSSQTITLDSDENTAGEDASLCSLNTSLDATSTEAGLWTILTSPSPTAIVDFADANNPQTSVSVNEGGTYVFLWSHVDAFSNVCFDEDEVSVSFAEPMDTTINIVCSADNLTYDLSVSITGGFPPYIVNGSQIAGNLYTLTLNDGEAYSLVIDDSGNCDEIEVIGSFSCFCPPAADPDVVANNLNYCEGTTIPTFSVVDNGIDTYNWYANETDTVPLETGVSFTPSMPGTYWVEAVSPDGCASENRTLVVLEETPAPNPPVVLPLSAIVVQNQLFTTEAIPNEGGEINWYNELGELVFTGLLYELPTDLVGDYTLTITETVNGCESEPTIFEYTVNPFDIETCPNITSFSIPDTLHVCTGTEVGFSFLNNDNNNLLRAEWVDLEGNVLSDSKLITVSETVTGCDFQVFQYVARTYCVINNVDFFDSDTATIIFYPFPESANIVTSNAGCSIQIFPQPPCPNFSVYTDEDVLVEGVVDFPLGSGTVTYILANDDADEQGLFDCSNTIDYDYNCTGSDCPVISNLSAPAAVCSGEEVTLTPTIDDPNNQLDRIEWLLPDGSTIGGNSLMINETATGCDAESLTYELRIYCSQDPQAIFDSREVTILVYPNYEVDLLVTTNEECMVPTLSTNCDNYLIAEVDVPSVVNEGDSGTAIWNVTHVNACFDEEISIPYNCPDPGCPTVDPPVAVSNTEIVICEGAVNNEAFAVTVPFEIWVNWYDVETGGTPIAEGLTEFTATSAGTYYAEAMILFENCISDTRTAFTLTVNPLDDASFSYPSTAYCLTESNPIPDLVATPNGSFSSPDGIQVDAVTGEINLSALTMGTEYTIEYQTAGDCPNTSNFTFNIIEDNLEVDAGDAISVCRDEPILLNGETLLGTANAFEWSANIAGDFDNPLDLISSFTPIDNDENFYLYLSATNNCGDAFVDSVEVSIIAGDNLEVDAGDAINICQGESISLVGEMLLGTANAFEWSTNIEGDFDNPLGLISSFTPTNEEENFYLYLSATNNCDIAFVDSVEVLITDIGELNLSGNTTLNLGETTQLVITGGNETFTWASHPNLSCTECADPVFTATTAGTTTLIVESSSDCVPPLTVNINVIRPEPDAARLVFPSAFSPNGDGVNDVFRATSSAPLESFSLLIYNRWGEQVFQTTDINVAWDGSFDNKVADIGVYAYVLQYQFVGEQPALERGNVTIVW